MWVVSLYYDHWFLLIAYINKGDNKIFCFHLSSNLKCVEMNFQKLSIKWIIGAYLSSTKQRVISTQLGIPISTVNDTIKRYKETGSTEPKKHSG